MLYGINKYNEKIKAYPGLHAKCPLCELELIPKCGNIKIWHWAHKRKKIECDHKGETDWHLWWKSLLPKEQCEVRIEKNGKLKIADAVLRCGKVVEFQNSSISSEEIQHRENFYGNMFWIFNCIDAFEAQRIDLRPNWYLSSNPFAHDEYWVKSHMEIYQKIEDNKKWTAKYFTFRWRHAKKSIGFCQKPVYLDFGEHVLRLKKIYTISPVGGWGYLKPKEVLTNFLKNRHDQNDCQKMDARQGRRTF